MPLTTFDHTVPTMKAGFRALGPDVDKVEAHCQTRRQPPKEIRQGRLALDMMSFIGQIQRASDNAKIGLARLTAVA